MRHRVHAFYSFAFARILCSAMAGLQRGSAFGKGFGPIKWRGELRRNSAQDTPSRHSGTAGSFILWLVQKNFSLFLGSFRRKPESSECRPYTTGCRIESGITLGRWLHSRLWTPQWLWHCPHSNPPRQMAKELMKFERFWLQFFLFALILSVFAYRI